MVAAVTAVLAMASGKTLFSNHFELRGTKRHEPTPPSPLHGCQHLKFWVSEMGTIPSVPSAYPDGPELPSLLLAKQLGQGFRWGTLQGEEQDWRSALPVLAQQVLAHWSAL